ncbi:MAG: 50S ribosomal protein L6 [bacterium]|nr:50S ribosomal protein L6 [bacterium]
MSRIGKKPIEIPKGVTVTKNGSLVIVKGEKGELERTLVREIDLDIAEGMLTVKPIGTSRKTPALWGLYRALIQNMIDGVAKGFEKRLEIEGVGYRAALEGKDLTFALGFSHPVKFPAPDGITFTVEKNTILIRGADKERVGETAAKIRDLKPPEPYKGKGIRYAGEVIRRKAGKKAVAAGG